MQPKHSTIGRSVIIGFAIFALAGCAQFQDSFGEITAPDRSSSEYTAINPETTAMEHRSGDSSDRRGARSFTYGGVKVQLSDRERIE